MIEIILILSILAGQIIKFPLFGIQGPTLLDFTVFALSLFGLYQTKFKFKKPNVIYKTGALFVLTAILSLIFTPLHLKPFEYLISFSYTLRFALYLFFSYLIYSGAFSSLKKNISNILIFSGVGLSLLGLLQLIFVPNLEFLQTLGWDPHYFRTVSTLLDPNFAGAFFVLTLMLLFTHSRLLFFILVYSALLTTFSRSSYLMFLISGVTLSFLNKSKKILLFTIILFILLLTGFQIYSQQVAKPRGINREQSASFRLDTWQQGLTIFQKSPIFGVGFNSYKYAVAQYNLSDSQFLDSRGSTTNDSGFLYVLATTGVVGFIAYFLFLLSILKLSFKNNFVLFSGILGLTLHSFFANSLFYPFILIWILLQVSDTKS